MGLYGDYVHLVWDCLVSGTSSIVMYAKGCSVILGCILFVFGIFYLYHMDFRIPYINNGDGKLSWHSSAGGNIHNNFSSMVKHSDQYANSSKGFMLHTIDSLDVNIRTKLHMKKALRYGGNDSKVMMDMLAGTLGGMFEKLNRGYRQRLPDAMIIGCKKCGTTFFNGVLRKHSGVASQSKEVHFFDFPEIWHRNMDVYRSRMMYSFRDQLTMEKTPKYWVTESAPEEIHRMNPGIKLILLVREPACRVVSDYYQEVKTRYIRNTTTFIDIITKQTDQHNEIKAFLLRPSLYDIHMQNWLRTFPMEQIMIIKNEDLSTRKLSGIIHKTEKYLGLKHELDVTISVNNTQLCITNKIGDRNICFSVKDGKCKYENQFGSYFKDIQKYLRPHVRKFEKIVNKNFHWF